MEQEKKPLGFDWNEVVEEIEEDKLTFLEIQAEAASNQVRRLRELKNKGNKITDKDVRAAERIATYRFSVLIEECERVGVYGYSFLSGSAKFFDT